MSAEVFARRVQAVRDRMAALERQAGDWPVTERSLLVDALDLLGDAVGALGEAEEDLAEEHARRANLEAENARLHRETQQAYERLHGQIARSQALAEASRAFAAVRLDLPAVLEAITHRLVAVLGDACAIRLLSEEGQWLEPVAVYHPDPQKLEVMRALLASELLRAGEGLTGQVIRTGKPLLIPAVEPEAFHAPIKPAYQQLLDRVGVHSLLIVPLQTQGRTFGTMIMSRDSAGRAYTADDLAFLHDLADRAAIAIANARLYRAAQEQREWFRVTLSSIGDAVIVADTAGRVTFMNGVAQSLTGWKEAEATGRALGEVFRIVDQDSGAPAADPVAQVLETGGVVGLANHTHLIAHDGAERPIDDSGAPIKDDQGNIVGVVLVFRDITERTRLETEARQSRDRLDIILRHLADGITLQDQTGRLIYANDAAARLIGYPSAQALLATPLAEIMRRYAIADEAGQPFPLDRLPGRLALQGEPNPEALVRFRLLETGEEHWSLLKATPVFDARGQIQFAINMFHDITAIKLAQAELQARARQQDAVAELGQQALEGSDIDALLDEAVALVARTLEVENCKVLELLPSGDALLLRAGVGWHDGLVGRATVGTQKGSHGGYTLLSNEPVIVDDLRTETRFSEPLLNDHRVISGLSVIIGDREQPYGVLGAHTTRHRTFTADDVHFLQAIASTLAAAIVRGRAEAALHEQREWLEITLSSIGDAVIATDALGRVTFMNAVAESLTGWTRAAASGQDLTTVFRIVNESTRQIVENPTTRVLREGMVVGLANHTILVARDGTEHPIDDSGAPIRNRAGRLIGVVLVFRDITERKRAEDAQHFLGEASAVLAASLNYETTLGRVAELAVPHIADWCAVDMLAEDGAIQRVAVEHVDAAKVAWAHELQRRYPPDPNARGGVANVLRTGRPELYPNITGEMLAASARDAEHLQIIHAVGFTSAIIVPLVARGRTLGAISFVSAESGRHYGRADLALVEELGRRAALAVDNARLYREAQAAIRVRDQFLSIASHELKTPLTVLLGNAQLLQRRATREGSFTGRNQRAIEVITAQAERLNKMIGALLDISRIQIGQLSIERAPLDLGALARRVVAEVQPSLDHHTVECMIQDEPLIVAGDALRLEQVLQNLIGNAIKYSPAGGPVVVRIERCDTMACTAVTDQGMGIPASALPKLFNRFYRASNVDPQQIAGMGIGLYVVKEIVALHGGEVTVSSTEGQGSTFTVCLPLADDSAGPYAALPVAGAEDAGGTLGNEEAGAVG